MKIDRNLIVLAGVLLYVSSAQAQVSCSPNVEKNVCAGAARNLDQVVDHGAYAGVAIPTEIVTPSEYVKRLADVRELEEREQSILGGPDKAAKSPDEFSPWHRHTLTSNGTQQITFFREKPLSGFVSTILISSVAFEGVTLHPVEGGVRLQPDGQYDEHKAEQVATFIYGYISGTAGKSDDRSEPLGLYHLDDDGELSMRSGKHPSNFPRFQPLTPDIAYDRKTGQPCWSDSEEKHEADVTAYTKTPPEKMPTCKALGQGISNGNSLQR